MRAVEVGGVVHEIECNAFTPFVYAEEFTTERNGRTVHEDINVAITEISNVIDECDVPPLLKTLQVFWAFEKTANVKTPSFKNWLRKMPNAALDLTKEEGWASVVMDMIQENFFPESANSVVATATE